MIIDEFLFANIPSKARTKAIEASVTVEKVISTMLSLLLGIKYDDKKPFAKSIIDLSFSQKLTLLSDIDAISSEGKGKLQKFSEIRNLFAHNASIVFFYDCYKHNNLDEYLRKRYGSNLDKIYSGESKNELMFDQLFNDVKDICIRPINPIFFHRNKFSKLAS